MVKAVMRIGPADAGRAMSLGEFDCVEFDEGYIYELGRGTIVVSGVPRRDHLKRFTALRRQLAAYDLANPGRIDTIAGGTSARSLSQVSILNAIPTWRSTSRPHRRVRTFGLPGFPRLSLKSSRPVPSTATTKRNAKNISLGESRNTGLSMAKKMRSSYCAGPEGDGDNRFWDRRTLMRPACCQASSYGVGLSC